MGEPEQPLMMPAADPVSQTIEWRLELPSAAVRGVVPGQQVRVRFVGGQAERVVVLPRRSCAAAN